MTIEVFKTNVSNKDYANFLLRIIEHVFTGYEANFDLDDCDRILRIKSASDVINNNGVIQLMKDFHVEAEVLGDEPAEVASEHYPTSIFISDLMKNTN